MAASDDFQRELMGIFQAELEDHLGVLTKGLLALEQSAGGEARAAVLTDLFRAAHSLKGAARAVGLADLGAIAHRLEDALSAVRQSARPVEAAHTDALLGATDLLRESAAAQTRGEPPPAARLDAVFERLEAVTRAHAAPAPPRRPRPAVMPAAAPAAAGRSLLDRLSEFVPAPAGADHPEAPEPQPAAPLDPAPVDPPAPAAAPEPAVVAETGLPGEPASAPRISRPPAGEDTIRVATGKLDALMDSLGELLVARLRAEQVLEQVRALQQRGQRWQKSWRAARPQVRGWRSTRAAPAAADLSAGLDFLARNEQELNALTAELAALAGRLANDRNHLQLVVDELQTGIRKTRLLPIGTLFDFFPRMLRDLARERGKELTLQVAGAGVEVDRQALELLKDPLTHLLRNAVDHGLEPPAERQRAGKPRAGVIHLRAEQRGSQLVLEVADDGRGIHLDRVRASAVQRGLVTAAEAANLGPEAVVDLIFAPGLSTAETLTDISGRGVGMDVVRANLEQLRGVIQVDTQPDRGTTFRLFLPLTLTTSHVLLVRAGGETVALPVMNVERLLRVAAETVGAVDGRPVLTVAGRVLPFAELARLLELPAVSAPVTPAERLAVVVLNVAGRRLAVRVDELLAEQEVVLKSLGRQLRRVRNVAGATVLGDGQLVAVLNPADLLKSALAGAAALSSLTVSAPAPAARRRILLADDSITTRTMEKHILEAAGYIVIAAADGREAWEAIRQAETPPDLVVSDVDMPHMTGLALTEALKADARLARIPVVLVTSQDAPAERLRGLNAGADAYLVKTAFDQRLLVETVGRLIG